MTHGAHREPLYRKVNTQTHRVHHHTGGNYRTERKALGESDASRSPMHGKSRRGLDYTPLSRFLLSKVAGRSFPGSGPQRSCSRIVTSLE
jgi:hypothetical protein